MPFWKKAAAQRPPMLLIVDPPDADTAAFARALGQAGVHVFWTCAPEVGLRLSREFYYDIVLVDARMEDGGLAEALRRDGHRSVVLSADEAEWPRTSGPAVDGGLRRPIASDRLARLASDLARTGDVDAFKRALDFGG